MEPQEGYASFSKFIASAHFVWDKQLLGFIKPRSTAHLHPTTTLLNLLCLQDPFDAYAKLIFEIDFSLLSQVASYDDLVSTLRQHRKTLSLATEPAEHVLYDSPTCSSTIQVPEASPESQLLLTLQHCFQLVPLNLKMLVESGLKKEESFVSFDSGEGQKEKNELLYGVLRHILANMSGASIPHTGSSAVFGKYVPSAILCASSNTFFPALFALERCSKRRSCCC